MSYLVCKNTRFWGLSLQTLYRGFAPGPHRPPDSLSVESKKFLKY